jgi:hypothetical protein
MADSFLRNLGLKFVSLALATLLWLGVAGQQVVERNLRVPLEFHNVPPGLEVVGEPPDSVDVRVRGSSGNLARVQPGEVVAVMDLRGARAGDRLFHLMPDEVRVPFGVDVVQVTPGSLALRFEVSGRKVVPVVPDVEGDPAPGYVLGRVTADPATVEVVGPVSRLRELTAATTETVSVDGQTKTMEDRVTLGVPDSLLRLQTHSEALVKVEVVPAPVERTIPGVAVTAVQAGERARVSIMPARVAVTVRGTRTSLGQLTDADLKAQVDLTSLGPGRYTLPVRAEAPDAVGIVRIEPRTAQVHVK